MSDEIKRAARDVAAYLPDWIQYQLDQRRCPGAQVAVRLNDELVFSQAFGYANLETREPLGTDHLFRIASHSKWFTATAVMLLAEDGKIRLDDSLDELLPDYADTELAAVTVGDLLSHRAGVIRDGVASDYWQFDGEFHDARSLLALIREHGKVFEPNEFFKYTNIGFSLLGQLIEAVTGVEYNDFVAREICKPLGLSNTGPEYDESRSREYAAGHSRAYIPSNDRDVLGHVDTRAMSSATGFYSTAEDITRFGLSHVIGNEERITDASKRRMQHPNSTITRGAETVYYGFGTQIIDIGDRRVVGHSGGYPGHISRTYADPASGLAVSALTNAIDGPADPIVVGIIKLINLALKGRDAWQPATPRETLDRFTGRFESLWGTTDIVALGGRPVGINPVAADPASDVDELAVADSRTLVTERRNDFTDSGEPLVFEFDANGYPVKFRTTGQSQYAVATGSAGPTRP